MIAAIFHTKRAKIIGLTIMVYGLFICSSAAEE
jgi:hypothetical protein